MEDSRQDNELPKRFFTRIFFSHKPGCRRCNTTDHNASGCPDKKRESSIDDNVQRCYNCGMPGHISRMCRKVNSQQESQLPPPNASTIGSSSTSSTNDQQGNQPRIYDKGDSRMCYNCGIVGHISRNCLKPPSGKRQGISRQLNVCYNCNLVGHLSRNCTLPRKERFNAHSSSL